MSKFVSEQEFHYTVEEVMATPGYCRDRYERTIKKLRDKILELEVVIECMENGTP